ncbi:MAG: hypothetical protein ACFFC1_13780 [Promethearchaeota archaeon]
MNWLSLIGLIFNFVGSVLLIWDTLINYTKGKSYVQVIYPDTPEKREVHRYNSKYKPVKITKEEILMTLSLSLISIGFLLQIIGFLI